MTTPSLPIPATSFVGRSHELTRIADLLADPNCRLLTLLGPGGIGKTRLALQAAADQSSFTDGTFFVHLTPVSAPDLIPSATASALQITFFDSSALRRQLADYLREKHLLLVMDNFEHLLEGLDLLIDLLQAAPHVKFLVTSRERLNIQEEWVLALEGLSFPEGEDSAPLESYSAIQLFAQRARQVQVNFSLSENDSAVRKICQQVEGMPLGIELAATWLRAMSPQQIVAHMESDLGFLTTPLRNVAERHRSLYRVFEQSWKLLSTNEQNVLMRLSIFRGFNLEAAEQVAGASLAILAGLTDKSLIRINRNGRYDLHELLRQFAEEQLKTAEAAEATRSAHSDYYLRFVAQRDEDIKGRRQQVGLHEIRTDLENIRAGWRWAVDHQQYALITTPVLNCLVNFGEMGNQSVEMHKFLKDAEAVLRAKIVDQAEPLLDQIAIRVERMNFLTGKPIDNQRLEIILERTRQRGDKSEIAFCLWVMEIHSATTHDHVSQLRVIDESLRLWREIGDDFYVAHALMAWGGYNLIHQHEGKQWIEALHESVQIRRHRGDLNNLAYSLLQFTYYCVLMGRFSEVTPLLDEALAIHDEIGPISTYPLIKTAKAISAFWRGEFDVAMAEIQAEDRFVDEYVYKNMRVSEAVFSILASMRGDYHQAYDLIQHHIHTAASFVQEWGRYGLAVAACGLGKDDEAGQALHDLLTHSPSSYSPIWQRIALPVAAILAARANQPEWAVELIGLAFDGPRELIGWIEKWPLLSEVQQQLKDQLGVEAFRNAWEQGQTLQLETVARILRDQGQTVETHRQLSASEMANRALIEPLSERELDVLRLIAEGHSNQKIADHLVISVTTVKKHINHIFGKLGVQSRTQAVTHAQALNLL